MSHSKDEEDSENIRCLIDHANILLEVLQGVDGVVRKSKIIKELLKIRKRVDYMLTEELKVNLAEIDFDKVM